MNPIIQMIHDITEIEETLSLEDVKTFTRLIKTLDYKIRRNLPVIASEFRELTELHKRATTL